MRSCPFSAQVRRFPCFRISVVCQRHFASLHVYLQFATGDITFKDLTKLKRQLVSYASQKINENHVEMYPRTQGPFPARRPMEVFGVQKGFCCWWHVLTTADPLCRCLQPFLMTAFQGHAGRSETG